MNCLVQNYQRWLTFTLNGIILYLKVKKLVFAPEDRFCPLSP